MQIVLNRNTPSGVYQKIIWGVVAGKIWTAVRGGCSRNSHNPDTVYGMVLGDVAAYTESGVYIPVYRDNRCESFWLNANDAILADFEQHMVFANGAVWLWCVLGTCDKEYLVPHAALFHWIPAEQQIMTWNRPWQITAAIMCTTMAEAVWRDEFAREV